MSDEQPSQPDEPGEAERPDPEATAIGRRVVLGPHGEGPGGTSTAGEGDAGTEGGTGEEAHEPADYAEVTELLDAAAPMDAVEGIEAELAIEAEATASPESQQPTAPHASPSPPAAEPAEDTIERTAPHAAAAAPPPPSEPAPVYASPDGGEPGSMAAVPDAGGGGPFAAAMHFTSDHPEALVGAAFAVGVVFALIVRRRASRR